MNIISLLNLLYTTRGPCEGLDSKGKAGLLECVLPLYFPVLSCTSTVLLLYFPVPPLYFHCISLYFHCTPCTPLYFGSTGVSSFFPWLDFNIIRKIDLIYIRKKFLNVKYNILIDD